MRVMAHIWDSLSRWIRNDTQRSFYERHCPEVLKKESMEIRPMRKRDLKSVVAIESSAYSFPWSLDIFKNCLKVGYSCWVGERGGEVITYGILSVAAGEAHVMNICVAPKWQGCGYGYRMLKRLMQVAWSHRAEMILLEVRPSNKAAIHLYQKLGFNEIGQRKGYYPAAGGKREDAIVLARMLE